ncbi:MAG: Holliday junction branch migration protein RuvA [Spirochaetota bacterium]
MFNSLTGEVTWCRDGLLRLTTGGVEWELEISGATEEALQGRDGPQRVFVALYHREDAMRLYGFAAPEERELYYQLLKVTGIGPRQALRILSAASTEELVAAIEAADVDALARLPGLGKKTAGKIIIALQGVVRLAGGAGTVGGGVAAADGGDLVDALVGMGFDRKRSEEAVRGARTALADSELSPQERERETLRRAIVSLS